MTDLPGLAIRDYYFGKKSTKLFVHDEFGPKVEMPIEAYFRSQSEMPDLEKTALHLASGKILDVGAGAGSHVLTLQKAGKDAAALEISPTSAQVMRQRGIQHVIRGDYFVYSGEKYDTLLFLMNGIGLAGTVSGLKKLLTQAENLLNEGGQILFDSCDIAYMYEDLLPETPYYGEMRVHYSYGALATPWFRWLYVDSDTMEEEAARLGWQMEIIEEDDNAQYLARLFR